MDKEYLIQEKPLKALLIFAFPMIIGNLFQQFYTMVDSVVVGRFVSEHALQRWVHLTLLLMYLSPLRLVEGLEHLCLPAVILVPGSTGR